MDACTFRKLRERGRGEGRARGLPALRVLGEVRVDRGREPSLSGGSSTAPASVSHSRLQLDVITEDLDTAGVQTSSGDSRQRTVTGRKTRPRLLRAAFLRALGSGPPTHRLLRPKQPRASCPGTGSAEGAVAREMEETPAGEKSACSCRHSSPPANPAFRGILKSPSLSEMVARALLPNLRGTQTLRRAGNLRILFPGG